MESGTTQRGIVLCIAMGLLGLCFRAAAVNTDGGLIAGVTLTSGKVTKITNVSGEITYTGHDGGTVSVPFQNIQSLQLSKEGVTILLVGGQSVSGTVEPFSVGGEGDFGSLTVKSTSISSVVFSNHSQTEARTIGEPSADIHLADGSIRRVTSIYLGRLECAVGGFILDLSPLGLSTLQLGNGGVDLKALLVDGQSLSATAKPFTILGQVEFGSVTYHSKDVTSMVFLPSRSQVATRTPGGIQVSLTSTEGPSIVRDVPVVVEI